MSEKVRKAIDRSSNIDRKRARGSDPTRDGWTPVARTLARPWIACDAVRGLKQAVGVRGPGGDTSPGQKVSRRQLKCRLHAKPALLNCPGTESPVQRILVRVTDSYWCSSLERHRGANGRPNARQFSDCLNTISFCHQCGTVRTFRL